MIEHSKKENMMRGVKLTPKEKEEMLRAILVRIKSAPIEKRSVFWERISISFFVSAVPKYAYAIVLVAITLFGAGGAVYAAEKALPGEPLYPLKVNISEPLRGVLAFNSEDKARWEAERAERRLAEAEILVARGELDSDKRNNIEKKFVESAEKFETLVAQAEMDIDSSEDILDIRLAHEAKLSAHSSILSEFEAGADTEVATEIKKLKEAVDKQKIAAAGERAQKESAFVQVRGSTMASGSPEIASKKKEIESTIAATEQELAKSYQENALSETMLDLAKTKLESAKDGLQSVQTKSGKGDVSGAYSMLFSSERSAEEAAVSLDRVKKLSKEMKDKKWGKGRSVTAGLPSGTSTTLDAIATSSPEQETHKDISTSSEKSVVIFQFSDASGLLSGKNVKIKERWLCKIGEPCGSPILFQGTTDYNGQLFVPVDIMKKNFNVLIDGYYTKGPFLAEEYSDSGIISVKMVIKE